MRPFLHRFAVSLATLCIVIPAGSVRATTLTVTSTADSGPGSLRDTVAAANDGDTIQFDTAINGQTISLTSGELMIDKSLTISGPGPNTLAVSMGSNAGPTAIRAQAEMRPNVLALSSPPEGTGFRIFHVMPGHTVVIAGLTISRGNHSGGGIRNDQAMLTINHCIVSSNLDRTTEGGGGIYNHGISATLTIVNSTVSGNLALGGNGGGIYNQGTVTITNSTVSDNMSPTSSNSANGGGIYNTGTLEISDSTISGNHAGISGGGMVNSGMLTIVDSTVVGNLAGTDIEGSGYGGGIYNTGILQIRNSTVSDNSAASIKGATGIGGGIVSGGPLTIMNSTISGNFANQDGGGIRNGGPLTIINSTISDNRADRDGGGIINYAGLEIGNTILKTGASGANIVNSGGTVTSGGYNLSSDNGGGFLTAAGDQINTNPMLGPLQNNGGPTLTHAPLPGSPAIDAGDPNFTPPPDTDQRGYARVFNGRIDIGSLEVQPTPTPGPTATPTPTSTVAPTPSPTVTATPSATPTPTSTPGPTVTPPASPAQSLNISTRLRVETDNNVMIGGFIITGNTPKNVAVRGIGPSLSGAGLSDVLADPTLELRAANGALILQNDDWQDDPVQAAQLSALGVAPQDPRESGIVATLQPAAYTAILAGKNNSTGVGLVEVYDADAAAGSQLANISTRGFVQTGDNVMIGGFILGHSSNNTQVAVRGIGPSLAQFGLSPLLADPTLELHDGNGALLISNDDWQDDAMQAAQLSAHGLALQDPKESGIFASLPPGTFTAVLAGKNGGIGIGLVEIYNVQ